jgi:hypothetical protein
VGKSTPEITEALAEWLRAQRVFFVATAPLAATGLLNCSPKGLDTFRILGPREVAYLDLTGSGIETVAHVRENGRIVLMFCAFSGPPKIVRLHGTAEVVASDTPGFAALRAQFPDLPGARAVIRVAVARIGDSCGFGVPRCERVEDRDTLVRWIEAKDSAALARYRDEKNARSVDGLAGLGGAEPTPTHAPGERQP